MVYSWSWSVHGHGLFMVMVYSWSWSSHGLKTIFFIRSLTINTELFVKSVSYLSCLFMNSSVVLRITWLLRS
jgi:hypothetical protein